MYTVYTVYTVYSIYIVMMRKRICWEEHYSNRGDDIVIHLMLISIIVICYSVHLMVAQFWETSIWRCRRTEFCPCVKNLERRDLGLARPQWGREVRGWSRFATEICRSCASEKPSIDFWKIEPKLERKWGLIFSNPFGVFGSANWAEVYHSVDAYRGSASHRGKWKKCVNVLMWTNQSEGFRWY